jgi:XapX domain-containing protein
MRVLFVSLGVGLLVGVVYGVLRVRSPAPPIVALVGLLGILIGEQIPPFVKQMWLRESSETQRWPHRSSF